ncbi:hypothetical protein JOF56_000437 [Kibdelosporangium banguiense]|uniref:DUF6542 domain-containing protein n=1 Tax=Kibdelosporangium banguiense TaxID=1365924 RepID=A0ABS4T6L0_9PSEU|nr:DUF6542 domain-containing protein [Kibdelosporangium banguiense]MBP2320052.1 hypothetical protein [Kibdelosporangium banguiense]
MSTRFEIPGWLAVLGPAAIVIGGLALGGAVFPISIAVSCVAAALLVHRPAFFAVAVQPPLITAIVVTGSVFLGGASILDGAALLAQTFPYLVGTMAAVAVILFVRSRLEARAKQRDAASHHQLVAAQPG